MNLSNKLKQPKNKKIKKERMKCFICQIDSLYKTKSGEIRWNNVYYYIIYYSMGKFFFCHLVGVMLIREICFEYIQSIKWFDIKINKIQKVELIDLAIEAFNY